MAVAKTKIFIGALGVLVIIVALFWLLFRVAGGNAEDEKITYYIGRDSTWYPLDFRGKERNMVGFTNDMLQAIAEEEEFSVYMFEVGTNALYDGLELGEYDGILSHLTPNIVNRRVYGFSDPFYTTGPVLIVRRGSQATSLADMRGKVIGVEAGALQIYNISEPSDVAFIPYDTASLALEKLDDNEIDGVVLDALKAYAYTEGYYRGRLKVATSPLTDKGLRLVTMRDPKSLLLVSRFNEGLKKIKDKGIYGELIEKWGLTDTEIREDNKREFNKEEEWQAKED